MDKPAYFMRGTVFLLLLLVNLILIAQNPKKEIEHVIDKSEMPAKAVELIHDWIEEGKKVRFYRERDLDQMSFETKFIWKGSRYSVEFYEEGRLMDVEKIIGLEDIDSQTQTAIKKSLSEQFEKYKIRKIQRQFTGKGMSDEEIVEELMEGETEQLTIKYEIVVDGREHSGDMGPYEMRFDSLGKKLVERKIIRRSLDNLLY